MNQVRKILFLLSVLSLFSLNVVIAQDDDQFANTTIDSIQVSDGIYMLMGEGGNIGLSVGDDGVFMIDDQFAPLTEKIKATIATLSGKPIKFLINTHWHFDHTGGNENLGNEGVIIVAHDNVRERMSKDGFIAAFNQMVPAAAKVALPVITFNDTVTFHFNGQTIESLHVGNAHTDGDSIIFFKSANVIHMGDTFFNGFYPFMDASSEGSIEGMIRAARRVLNIIDNETKIIPGHGPLGNKVDLNNFLNMLIAVRNTMQELIDQGKTIEEIIALNPNEELDKTWGNGFLNPETFLRVLHSVMPQ